MFVIFNKISSSDIIIHKTDQFVSEYEKRNLWTGANILLMTTIDGIMMTELFGFYQCYKSPIISFQQNRNINISKIIFPTLNNYYGENHWAIEISYSGDVSCINEKGYTQYKCSLPQARNVKSYEFFYPRPCEISIGHGVIYVLR